MSGDINLAELFPWSYEQLVIQGKHTNISKIDGTAAGGGNGTRLKARHGHPVFHGRPFVRGR